VKIPTTEATQQATTSQSDKRTRGQHNGFCGLLEVSYVLSLQVGVRLAGCGSSFFVLLGGLLERSCSFASGFIKLG
jgi:hypothetical protein